MSDLEFRPRFHFLTSLAPDEVKVRLREAVRTHNMRHRFVLRVTGPHLILAYPHATRTAWTPQMEMDLEEVAGCTRIRCLIGPSSSIWMLFIGGYMFCLVLALLGLSIGVAQQVVGATAWGYSMALPTPFIALLLWMLAQGGKRRARTHMRELKRFVDQALSLELAVPADPS